MTTEKHEFQAETKRLLDLMIHSLYSNKEIFLRELISNASDALDKLRYQALTDTSLAAEDQHIRLTVDKAARTLTVSDNGIGMTRAEMIQNLGTIARSGTKEFLESLTKSDAASRPELIGQFGVGFYASFLVADKVEVVSRRAGSEEAFLWSSGGDGTFTLGEATRAEQGTSVTLHLKPENDDEGVADLTQPWQVERIVRKYSDFVAYPIRMREDRPLVASADAKPEDTAPPEDRVINSMKAIWMRAKSEVSDDEYNQFYKHISHDWSDPVARVAFSIEGNFEAKGLLFIPGKAPFDLFRSDMKRKGVHLYIKRVFIKDDCEELVPHYLRFIKGVVDAEDLPLNVSREILQQNGQVRVIRKQIVKKVLEQLGALASNERETYEELWAEFGAVLKEGLLYSPDKNEKVLDLVLAPSTQGEKLTTLAEYVGRMKEGQKQIYFLTNASLELARQSPHLEAFKARGLEVLFFTDHVDALWLSQNETFQEHRLVAIDGADVELPIASGSAESENEAPAADPEIDALLVTLRVSLQEEVKDVRSSSRLTDSPACLITDKGDMTPQMEKLLRVSGQPVPKTKRVLELNPKHPAVQKLAKLASANKDDPRVSSNAQLLYGQALLSEGGQLSNPAAFAKLVADLMVAA
ncbi:MAG: molecular chaperone HtpG [Myxococcales bacterium]|nr:molecular chaperone HtpG [Myxococcales bacterium]